MRRFVALAVALGLLALAGTACSSTLTDAATVTFRFKSGPKIEHIGRDTLLDEVSKLVANKPFATWLKQNNFGVSTNVSIDTSLSAIWLSQLLRQEAVDALFSSRHLKVTAATQAQAVKDVVNIFPTADIYPAFDAKYRATLADRQARLEQLYQSYADTSDAAGQAYFNAHESQFTCPSGKDVSHILVATQAEAESLLTQLRAGASFQTLAARYSTDTQSGAQGGALGCLAAGLFVPAFQNAAEHAPFDVPTGPVHSQFGYHIILVTHAPNTYEAARAQVQQALLQQAQLDAEAAITALQKTSKVHLDPRFGTWGLASNSQGQKVYRVTPPKGPVPNISREGTTTTTTTTLPLTTTPGSP